MAWHVLLLGAATEGLRGVSADLAGIRRVLRHCGIEDGAITEIERATRDDIVAGFEALIGRVRPDDGVVVYYSGHGIRLRDPDTQEIVYALVPVGASEALQRGEFGYVLREELGRWFVRLTDITRNVTWIADCCFAGGLRGERERGLKEALATFSALRREVCRELAPETLDPQGNPHLLRVCATASELKAYEDDELGGRMTRALESALSSIDYAPVVCEDLGRRLLRQRVLRGQQTVIAGPVGRWWLSARTAATTGFATTLLHSAGTLLAGGRLLDQRVGDRYVVLDASRRAAATLRITAVQGLDASALREPEDEGARLTVGSTAVLRQAGSPRGTVALALSEPLRSRLAAALTAPGYVALAGEGAAPTVARVESREGSLVVVAADGRELGGWSGEEAEAQVCAALEGLARQAALRGLRPGAEEGLQCGAARRGGCVELTNGSGRTCYATLFALRPDGAIELVTRGQPDGEMVPLSGPLRVEAPALPVVAIVCNARVDLRGWTWATATVPRREPDRSGPAGRFAVLVVEP